MHNFFSKYFERMGPHDGGTGCLGRGERKEDQVREVQLGIITPLSMFTEVVPPDGRSGKRGTSTLEGTNILGR